MADPSLRTHLAPLEVLSTYVIAAIAVPQLYYSSFTRPSLLHEGLASETNWVYRIAGNAGEVLPPSAKVLSANFCARGLGERVGGVNLTCAHGRSSFATRVCRVPLKIQQSHGPVQVTKHSMPNPRRCSRCCSSLRAPSRSTSRVGFVRMRVVASAIRESFIREMLYFI